MHVLFWKKIKNKNLFLSFFLKKTKSTTIKKMKALFDLIINIYEIVMNEFD